MVDGSVMPNVITGNINIPIVMMAERAADFIKADQYYRYSPQGPHEREEVQFTSQDASDYVPRRRRHA